MEEVYLVTSGKGGTGKSMVAVDLAAVYAAHGEKVAVVDMNGGARNLDLYFGKENDVVYDLSDVINGVCELDQALIKDDRFDDLYILAASPEIRIRGEQEDPDYIEKVKIVLGELRDEYDVVIVDMYSGLDSDMLKLAKMANKVLLVTTPEYASVRSTDAMDRALLVNDINKQYVIVNRIDPELMNDNIVPKLRDIARVLRSDTVGLIQEDKIINISTNLGVPIVLKQGTYISKNFDKIARKIQN